MPFISSIVIIIIIIIIITLHYYHHLYYSSPFTASHPINEYNPLSRLVTICNNNNSSITINITIVCICYICTHLVCCIQGCAEVE